ncbi:MAG: AAA family ATPase [Planctomycetota bacterium]|jgi:hypothetical protein
MGDPLSAFATDRMSPKPNPRGNGRGTHAVQNDQQPIVDVVCLGDVKPKRVGWFWRPYFPLGMLSVISGDPNVGKSTVLDDMTARATVGRPWPDLQSEPNPAGDVIRIIGEDSLAHTVRTRVDAAGGDPDRVFILNGIRHPESPEIVDPFSSGRDLRHLDQLLKDHPTARMLGIDPLDDTLGASVDSYRKTDVQRALGRLSTLAETHNVAVIGALHMRKSVSGEKALYRVLGSLGFVSAPRAVWAISRDKDDRCRRLMTCIKCNIAPDPTGLSFTIEDKGDVGLIHWSADPVTITADEALETEKPRARTARADAIDWLAETLVLGPMHSDRLKDAADDEGLSWSTLKRAKDELGIRARKRADGWYWELPVKETTEPG